MGYLSVEVIWEGALESVVEFDDDGTIRTIYGEDLGAATLDALVQRYRDEVEGVECPDSIEIFTLVHDHSPDVEDCACIQYATDHHPAYTFGGTQ